MADEKTETAAPVTETPAPVAVTPDVAQPAAASVATVEKPQAPEPKTTLKPADFFKQREEKREKKATERLTEVEKELADLKANVGKTQPHEEPLDFLNDPEKALLKSKEDAKNEVFAELDRRQAEAQRQATEQKENETAASWLLTRSHLKEDKELLKTVAGIIEDKYARIASVDPSGAARLAYMDACAAKGITPDIEGLVSAGFDNTKGTATSGTKLSAPATGKRVFARGEAERYIFEAKPGTPEYRARLSEVEEAQREGRTK